MHGIIQNDELVVVGQRHPKAKPIVYEDVPDFDQELFYIVQQPPVDVGSHIFMGIEIKNVEISDEDLEE